MATTKSKKVSNGRPTTAETAVKRMADFVEQVINSLGVELANGRITKKTYDAAIVKLDDAFKEAEYLWSEIGFLEGYAKELDAESKKKVDDLTAYYEGLISELEKEYEEKVQAAYRTGSENLDAIYSSFNATCDNMKAKLDEGHLSQQLQELKIQLQNKTAEAEEARVDAEYAESVAYDEYKSRKDIEAAYVVCKKQRDEYEAELRELQKRNQLKARTTTRMSDSYERAQKRIMVLERELAVVNDKIDGIKRNLIQAELCDQFGVPSDVSYGVKRAKAIKKAVRQAKHNNTYKTKLQNTTNALAEKYPDWFVDESVVSEELASASKKPKTTSRLYNQVESVLKSTVYKASATLKAGALLLLAGLTVVSAALVGNSRASSIEEARLNNRIAQQGETIDSQGQTIIDQGNYSQGLEGELEDTRRNWSDTQRELDDTKQQLEDMKVQEKQDFVIESSEVSPAVAKIVNRRVVGNIQNVAFTYNAKTGDIIMTAFVEQEGKTVLVVGEGVINTGCKLDASTVQQNISKMVVKAYNRYDEATGIYYNVVTASRNMGETCAASACKVQLGADGTIAEILQSDYSKTGKTVDEQSVIDYVLSDIVNQNSQNVNDP